MTNSSLKVRLKVSAEVARIVGKSAPRDLRLSAARGAVSLSCRDMLTALFFLLHGQDPEVKDLARKTLAGLPAEDLGTLAADPDLHPQLLDFVARVRLRDRGLMELLLGNPSVAPETLVFVGTRADLETLDLLTRNEERLGQSPEIVEAILGNPLADLGLKQRLGQVKDEEATLAQTKDLQDVEGEEELQEEALDDEHLSKYQKALEMGVSEKIKMALTGDKEWRSILIKDANKLVSAAVIKNPRITDGEVLAVARNKTSSDDLIRLINLNREWVKNLEVKKALVMHPKTPLPKALRYMNVLTEKDLKNLAKSRSVSQVIANSARRLLAQKDKKK